MSTSDVEDRVALLLELVEISLGKAPVAEDVARFCVVARLAADRGLLLDSEELHDLRDQRVEIDLLRSANQEIARRDDSDGLAGVVREYLDLRAFGAPPDRTQQALDHLAELTGWSLPEASPR